MSLVTGHDMKMMMTSDKLTKVPISVSCICTNVRKIVSIFSKRE